MPSRRPTSPQDGSGLRRAGDLAVGLAVCGYLISAAVGLPLFEDGSFYLFVVATEHAPELPNLRFSALLPQLPAAAAFALGADLALGRTVFAAVYAAIPTLSLIACWVLLRRRAPALLLLVLPSFLVMQLNFSGVSELLSAFYLTWPVLLAMLLLPARRWVMALAIAWGPFLLLLHPLAFVFCFGLGLLAWSQTWRRCEPIAAAPPRAWRHIALWLGGNGLARLLWTAFGLNDYERGRLNPSSAVNYMLTETIAQHVLVALLILTTLLALWTLRRDPDPSGRAPMLVATLWLTLLNAVWVSGEYMLGTGIVLKSAITVGVGVLGMLSVTRLVLGQDGARARACGRGSAMALRLAGAALLTMLLAKSSAWHTGVRGLQDIVASTDSACIRFAADAPYSLQWPWMAITDAWSAPVTALVTRPFVPDADGSGFQPVAMMLKGDGCEALQATGEARLPADTQISFERLDATFGPLRPPRRLPR